jgi:acyl-coenzyme A thioesterase PaaI-like protein
MPSHQPGQPTVDERASHCFACGPDNPQGLHLTFDFDPATITTTAHLELTRLHEGPPGYIHGGIIATLMDEAMSKLNRPLNTLAMTRHMEVDYLRPAPIHQPLILTGTHLRREGRKLFHQAKLQLSDGTVLARGKGLFIALDEKVLAAAGFTAPQP